MLLVALALPLLALASLGPFARGGALLALVALYVPLAGAGPSLQRAGIMGAAGIAAMMLSRPASRWYALLLAAAATLILSPRADGDPGWQLSFVAVAGILVLGRPLAAVLARTSDRTTATTRLRARGRTVLARRVGLAPDAGPDEVRAAGLRAGLTEADAAALAGGDDGPGRTADLQAVGRALARLEGDTR